MPQLFITFKGICTQLIAKHHHATAPRFDLWTGDRPIRHRVFLANSDLIKTQIDPKRKVPYHVPKMRIPSAFMPPKLEPKFKLDPSGRWYERELKDEAIAFANASPKKGDRCCHEEALDDFPSMWNFAPGQAPVLRRRVLTGEWTRYASAYIDFTGGLQFEAAEGCTPSRDCDLHATVSFKKTPTMELRPYNEDEKAECFDLRDGTKIEITNLPEENNCFDSDYLLHYFATTLDLWEDAPVWPKPKPTVESPNPVAYCSSSTYP